MKGVPIGRFLRVRPRYGRAGKTPRRAMQKLSVRVRLHVVVRKAAAGDAQRVERHRRVRRDGVVECHRPRLRTPVVVALREVGVTRIGHRSVAVGRHEVVVVKRDFRLDQRDELAAADLADEPLAQALARGPIASARCPACRAGRRSTCRRRRKTCRAARTARCSARSAAAGRRKTPSQSAESCTPRCGFRRRTG